MSNRPVAYQPDHSEACAVVYVGPSLCAGEEPAIICSIRNICELWIVNYGLKVVSLRTNQYGRMNKVMLIGNVGKDPEVKYIDRGVCVASLSLATTERGYTLQNGTEVPPRTEWHNVVFWRGLAEVVEKYVHKGDKLFIEGQIHSRSYDDRSGIRHHVTEIWAESLERLTSTIHDSQQ